MAKNRGKKYQDALKKVDSKKKYAVNDAVQLVKDIDFANFDSTVEVEMCIRDRSLSNQD